MRSKQVHLIKRDRSSLHGGTYEIWDVGNSEYGIFVDFNPKIPETMAFRYAFRCSDVENWDELGVWPNDATGGQAIYELGYEIEES